MAEILIGPMLRYVGQHEATIWLETSEPCEVEILGRRQHTFTAFGHHYALVVIEDLQPGSETPYEVALDGQQRWPALAGFPNSVIRTLSPQQDVRLVFGSCRAAAPHHPPYTLEPSDHADGRGIDVLRTIGQTMLTTETSHWPTVIVMLGDQVYADESSPGVQARLDQLDRGDVPPRVVANFEQYTWLYDEAWTPEVERWLLSTVPSTMIFDDHDTIDDWNISQAWVTKIRMETWWPEHIIGGMVSYWIYQHLGNLAPRRLAEEGLLAEAVAAGDATDLLRRWALESESFTPIPGGYQFSYDRHFGEVHLIVIDCRNGRVLDPGKRQMVDDDEWAWIVERAMEPARHVVLASSLPVFAPAGLHGLQQWNEALCDGAWGRLAVRPSEWLRQATDMEHWAAFDRSFRAVERLLIDVGTPTSARPAPASINVLAGDIHFAYVADVQMPPGVTSRVRQVVCSPMRNTLLRRDRRLMTTGIGRAGAMLGRWLQRSARRGASALRWTITSEVVFRNNIGTLRFVGEDDALTVQSVSVGEDGRPLLETMIERR